MNTGASYKHASHTVGQQLALNLSAALRVAGSQCEDGKPGPLRSVSVQGNTGIARSTLRALKSPAIGHDPNPDLRTLERLATILGIPIAFLLMRPQDWSALLLAINGIRDPLSAAEHLVGDELMTTDLVEKVLRKCGVHPDIPPIGAYEDRQELSRLNARNEWRRRTSHVIAALMQPAACDRASKIMLTALAASFVNQTTPNEPAAQ